MVANLIDGKRLAKLVELQVKHNIDQNVAQRGRPPGLGVILVGDDPASKAYVARKEKVAKRAGIQSFHQTLPTNSTQSQVLEQIENFNQDSRIDGILLQLPVPKHLNSPELLQTISAQKDADGLHPLNQGFLMGGINGVRPCTPAGVMRLIDVAIGEVNKRTRLKWKISCCNRSLYFSRKACSNDVTGKKCNGYGCAFKNKRY